MFASVPAPFMSLVNTWQAWGKAGKCKARCQAAVRQLRVGRDRQLKGKRQGLISDVGVRACTLQVAGEHLA